jgi:nucleotide-binding universal stress UspA family protein
VPGFFRTLTNIKKRIGGSSMYDRILVPLDGSEMAEGIMPHIEAVAAGHQAEVILFQVLPATGTIADVAAEQRYEADEYLGGVEKRLSEKGINVRYSIRHGADAAAEIVDYADVNDIDLIAMSTHGRSGIGRWVFGGVASKVLRGTNKPILLIRPPDAPILGA